MHIWSYRNKYTCFLISKVGPDFPKASLSSRPFSFVIVVGQIPRNLTPLRSTAPSNAQGWAVVWANGQLSNVFRKVKYWCSSKYQFYFSFHIRDFPCRLMSCYFSIEVYQGNNFCVLRSISSFVCTRTPNNTGERSLRFHSETTKKALELSKLSRAGSNVVLLVKCQSRSLSRYSEM